MGNHSKRDLWIEFFKAALVGRTAGQASAIADDALKILIDRDMKKGVS